MSFCKNTFLIGLLTIVSVSPSLLAAQGSLAEQEPYEDKPGTEGLMLQGIMQQMGKDMQEIAGAISHEDWARIAEIATQIADHPQPPFVEKMRILKFIGRDAAKFKGYDEQVHKAALDLTEAARRREGLEVIDAFAKVQGNCLACHQNFRDRFKVHFYGE
ncbi:cytochrome c [Methylophaga sp. OBS4]|uniref:cytochrome c n=1 Tax=Methylophaga sp. OBS4 TaxID=2991935 RepID=UPI0022575458|nr:cytochrome c [Methylophaga sp. OBS4]MCX4186988.1 cytochrome c [Methylophaga sp. OBS4]